MTLMSPATRQAAGNAGPMHANAARRFAAARHEVSGVTAPDFGTAFAPLV